MIIYGASGHGKVVEDIVEAMGQKVSCFVDDNQSVDSVHGIPVIHRYQPTAEPVIIAIGSNATRKRLAEKLEAHYAIAVHPSAVVSPRANIGDGTVVMAGAIVQTDAVIGNHCIINTGASVDHECRIGNFAHLSPHATLCGNVAVGEGTWIGAGATIIQGIHIGKWAVVGAGSVITNDVPDYALVLGNRQFTIKEDYYKQR